MSKKETNDVMRLKEALNQGDPSKAPSSLSATMEALQAAGVKSMSDDFIFSVAEDKLPELEKAIDADELIVDKAPEDMVTSKGDIPAGICNVFFDHSGCEELFSDNKLVAVPQLSAAVSAVMRRRS